MNVEINEDIYAPNPLSFDGLVPDPSRPISAPDDLDAFIRTNIRGMSRISVRKHMGGRRYSHINAVITGAGYDELPRATAVQISRGVMAIAAEDYEITSESARYMCQALIYKKAQGDPKKLSVIIEVGSSGAWNQEYSTTVQAPDHADQMFISHIHLCHAEILNQAKVISSLGSAALANVSEVFVAKENALQARADADRLALDADRETKAEENKNKRWQQMFGLAQKAVTTGVAQYMAGQNQQMMSSAPQPAAPPEPTETPDWARAAAGEAVELTPEPVSLEADPDDPPMEHGILDPFDHGLAECARSLYGSITVAQWPKLMGALSSAQLKLLLKLEEPESDNSVRKAVAKFGETIRPAQQVALMSILDHHQVAALMQMRQVDE